MSQLDFEFEAGTAHETLRDIIAMLAPDEADGVSELMQSGFKSAHYALAAGFTELESLTGKRTAKFLKLLDRLTRHLAHDKIMQTREVLSG